MERAVLQRAHRRREDVSTVPTASQAADCLQDGWNQSRSLARTLGSWAAEPDYPYPSVPRAEPTANHAVSSYTQGDSPAGVSDGRDRGAGDRRALLHRDGRCGPGELLDHEPRRPGGAARRRRFPSGRAFPGPIAACDLPVHQINGNNVGTFRGFTSLLAQSPSVEVALLNNLGGGGGDDNAFDNLALIDTTPQLDAVIAAPPSGDSYASDQPARFLLTVTNTHLAGSPAVPSGAKPEWSFDLALPAGLVPARARPSKRIARTARST